MCYAHGDSALVYPEIKCLHDQGINLWYDEGISAGKVWRAEIADALAAAETVLYFISTTALTSDHCNREINFALDRSKPVVPVYLENVDLTPDLHLGLDRVQALTHARTPEFRSHLLAAVGGVAHSPKSEPQPSTAPTSRTKRYAAIALGAVVAAGVGAALYQLNERGELERRLRIDVLPAIEQAIEKDNYIEAYELAASIEAKLGADPSLEPLWPRMSNPITLRTEPEGASVYARGYHADEQSWQHLGVTPIEGLRFPLGVFVFRFEKPGFTSTIRMERNPGFVTGKPLTDVSEGVFPGFETETVVMLEPETIHVPERVRVPGGATPVPFYGFGFGPTRLPAFEITTNEITNADFQRFVDAGGYQTPDYWPELTQDPSFSGELKEATARFTDTSGRTGPATWAYGRLLRATEREPVRGISWYEARAYARFLGGDLPTLQQFGKAALSPIEINLPFGPDIILRATFDVPAPTPVAESGAIGPYGTFDMLGNVREWVLNQERNSDQRFILGGDHAQPEYSYRFTDRISPWDRSSTNGMRVAFNAQPLPTGLDAPLAPPTSGEPFANPIAPIDDDAFETLRWQFTRSNTVEGHLEATTQSLYGTRELVTLTTSPPSEPMPVYLFLPSTNVRAPYQPVIMFPELSDWESPDSTERIEQIFPFPEFIVADGRVLVVPVFAGMYERYDGYPALPTAERLDVLVGRRMQWIKDVGNVIDYLESRADIDTSSVAYLGVSYGGTVALPLLIEPRLTTAVLVAAGVASFDARGAVPAPGNAINFLPRFTLPTLLITGDYDHIIVAEAQALLFDRLGTPDEHKKWVRHASSHVPFPRNQTVREVLGWLDRYMGGVQR